MYQIVLKILRIVYRIGLALLGLALLLLIFIYTLELGSSLLAYTYLVGGLLLVVLSVANPFGGYYRFGSLILVFVGLILGSGAQMDITPVAAVGSVLAVILFIASIKSDRRVGSIDKNYS